MHSSIHLFIHSYIHSFIHSKTLGSSTPRTEDGEKGQGNWSYIKMDRWLYRQADQWMDDAKNNEKEHDDNDALVCK